GALSQADLALAEPGDDGLSGQLAKFWSAWSDFANAPESNAARQALVNQGKTVASAFATLDGQLAGVGTQAADEYGSLTGPQGDVRAAADQIASLNDAISRAVAGGEQPNDLLDRRDALLDRLAQLGQVSVSELGDGSIQVAFGDAAA